MINKDAKITALLGIGITAILSIICFIINVWAGAFCLVLGIALTGVYFYNIKKRNDKINELNNYLSLMCSGNFDLDIMDNSEGEMSILKNNLYKIMTLLKTQNEQLNTDKLYLADSLADISHQLKTPLTSMMVMSDLLKDEKNEDKQNEFLSIIEVQLDKMKWLITNLLKISKLDAGTTEFKHEKFNISPVLEKSLKPFYVTCDIREIEIDNEINDFEFVGDDNWTGEAIENIIKNCIEHTENNGTIKFFSERTNVYNSLFIQDNGCGIAKEDLPHIFERFYHGKNSSSESVGIGLALAKTVLEKEKGDIIVNSELGKGSIFELRFYKAIV
ncbi:MAG: HAMP domain-containing sensor histidine kinase [Eubacteriales bacterium]|nr:HAMP domain-containing sensor histidine kinase [Eubacteriales bacterium]